MRAATPSCSRAPPTARWSAPDAVLAERLARAAVQAGGGFGAELALGRALAGAGRASEAQGLFAELEPEARDDDERAAVAMASARNLFWAPRAGPRTRTPCCAEPRRRRGRRRAAPRAGGAARAAHRRAGAAREPALAAGPAAARRARSTSGRGRPSRWAPSRPCSRAAGPTRRSRWPRQRCRSPAGTATSCRTPSPCCSACARWRCGSPAACVEATALSEGAYALSRAQSLRRARRSRRARWA